MEVAPKIQKTDLDDLPDNVKDLKLKHIDNVVLAQELCRIGLTAKAPTGEQGRWQSSQKRVEQGTYAGTQLVLTQMYDRIERA